MGHEPTSRRPIAGMFRRTADLAVRACVRAGIHPDVVSYASIVFAALAAGCFVGARWEVGLLWVAPLLCYVRLWLNMLDGMVALSAGKASKRGEIVNDLPDRVSDVLIFAGVAHSGLAWTGLGYWAAILAVMTAYVGITGQAVGVRRQFGGVMSKPWRMVWLHVGAWTTAGLATAGIATGFSLGGVYLSVMDVTLGVIIAGCVQTCVVRLRAIGRELKAGAA